MDANVIYSLFGRDKLGFTSKPVDEEALKHFLEGKELGLPASVFIEIITHFRNDADKLYDLIQFVSRCGMSIYNNIPDYCYEPSQLCILNNMSKVELQSYAMTLLKKKIEIEAKFVLLFHEITRDLYAEYRLRISKLSEEHKCNVLTYIARKGDKDCAEQLEAELSSQLTQGYEMHNEQRILKNFYIEKLNESCIFIDLIISSVEAYNNSETDFIKVIQNTYQKSVDEGLDGSNGTMKHLEEVFAEDKEFLADAKTKIADMFGRRSYSKKQTKYLSEIMFTAWYDRSQKLKKNDIFDMFAVGCLDSKSRSQALCVLEDNSPYLISFDRTMKSFIQTVNQNNYLMIDSINNEEINGV